MAWLSSGYSKRIKLSIDSSKIDAVLSWFPVTVFFTAAQAEEIFSEFDADSDYMKCAFTKEDGVTELYAEMELFDVSESKAIYHVSRDGWAISSSVDTDFYYYYDNEAADNTTYIGAVNTTTGAAVWDTSFKMVQHMADATTSTILDSTSNDHDGAKTAANNPIESVGIVGQAQDFLGDDEIIVTDHVDLDLTSNFLIEACVNIDDLSANRVILSKFWDGSTRAWHITASSTGIYSFKMRQSGDPADTSATSAAATAVIGTDTYVAVLNDGTNYQCCVNGVASGSPVVIKTMGINNAAVNIGDWAHTSLHGYMDGREDEIRVSSFAGTERNVAWIKATYNSLWDTLLTYGDEESGYYIAGYVTENTAPVNRQIYLHNRDTGALIGSTTSSGVGGYFYMETTYSGAHYVVCIDDAAGLDYNDLIYGRIYPTTVSG